VLGVAAGVAVFHLALSGRYGFHRDELYALAAGRRPALGYVDQAPLVPLLGRALTAAGTHLWPLRAAAGLAHGAVVVLVGLLARELGGGRRALVVAAVAAATMPLFLAAGSMFQTVVFDQVWWAATLVVVVRLVKGADPRWWLAVGALVGAGLQTRWTIALLAVGVVVGLAAVPEGRGHLRSPWLWAGGGVALLVWSPNLAWEALHGWPTLDLTRDGDHRVLAEEGRVGFVLQQVLVAGPVVVPLVAAGMVWLWWHRRALAVAAAVVALVLLAIGGPADDLGPVYVLGIAAGAVATEGWLAAEPHRWPRAVGALAANGLVPLAALAPVASLPVYAELFQDLDDELGEQVGWPEMVDLVAVVVGALPAEERADVRVIAAGDGEAAAIDLYGPARGLPRGTALSGDSSYADWWPDGEPAGTFVTVGYTLTELAPFCDAVGPVAAVAQVDGVDNEAALAPIHLCRELLVSPGELRDALARRD